MELFEVILLLLGAVLVSAVLDQVVPRVSLPLVQIAIGIVLGMLVGEPLDLEIDPELFLVLFIAPLLFDESRHANKRDLWDNKGAIVSLAVGLVLATLLVVGFTLNWLQPSIPLAAAFALGAALGPTDAVAVTALGKDISLSSRQKAQLSGEALINDASGVVSFQFAISAAVTGAFSLLDATASFAVSFFGGIAVGLLLGLVATIALRAIRSSGFESATVHVVFEVFTPFIVFLLAEHVHVSGILAVVAAGLLITLLPQKPTPVAARLKIASTSVWETVVFVINGVVFVLLGLQLPGALQPSWDSTHVDSGLLLLLVLLVTVLVVGVRFVWVLVMEAIHKSSRQRTRGDIVRDALVTTLSGPKGAVTLSIIMTIPFTQAPGVAFPHRDTLIFLASGVIILTLLLANFVVPAIAPKPVAKATADEDTTQAEIDILKSVIRQLKDQKTPQNKGATNVVIRQYQERIKRLRRQNTSASCMVALRAAALDAQLAFVRTSMEGGTVSKADGEQLISQIENSQKLLRRVRVKHKTVGEVWGRLKVSIVRTERAVRRVVGRMGSDEAERERVRLLRIELEKCSLEYYLSRIDDPDTEVADGAAVLATECRATLALLEAQGETDGLARMNVGAAVVGRDVGGIHGALDPMSTGAIRQIKARVTDVEAEALRMELDEIQRLREEGTISRDTARDLREEVYLLQIANGE